MVTFCIPKCSTLHDDPFQLYCTARRKGGGIPSAHAHVLIHNPLPVVQVACRVEDNKIISTVETVLRHGGMFQGSNKV